MSESFFYHSFPRARSGADVIETGIKILDCILRFGLVLAPEIRVVSLPASAGGVGGPIVVAQKRACFTLLAPAELQNHAEFFGPISLVWEVADLRRLGAAPAIYYAIDPQENSMEAISLSNLARLAEVQKIISQLKELSILASSSIRDDDVLNIELNGDVFPTNITIKNLREFVGIIGHGVCDFNHLEGALQGLSGYFCPIEDRHYTGDLGYYKQREWRICGNMSKDGAQITVPCPKELQEKLLEIDPDFWGRELNFRSGSAKRVSQSQQFYHFNDVPIINTVRCIVAPQKIISRVKRLVEKHALETPVVPLESYGE